MAAKMRFAVCVDNTDYRAALEVRKVYQVLPDPAAAARSYLRIIDESGQDYLYPRRMFLQLRLRPEARETLNKALSKRKRPKTWKKSPRRQSSTKPRRASASKRVKTA